jgi:hypothetical protein
MAGPTEANGAGGPGHAPERRTFSDRLPRPWMFPLLAWGAAWGLIVATWNVCNHLIYHESHGWYWWFWYKDSGFYWGVAAHWYAPQPNLAGAPDTAAFFPLYPALIRVCYYVVLGNKHGAGLLATVLSGAASAILVWALASRVKGRWVADRAVILYCAFPGAMMLGMMYSESLGIAVTAASLLAAVNRKWFLAGLFGLLATAEHPTLVVIVPALGLTALHAIWTRRDWRSLLAPALAPFGILGYFAWIGTRYHNYLFWFQLERKLWGQKVDFGRTELKLITFRWLGTSAAKHADYQLLCIIMFWVLVIGVVLMLYARLPLPISAYTVLLTISLFINNGAGPRPRLVWTAIGIFIGGAAKIPRWLFWPVVIISAAGLAFLDGWWPHHPKVPPP